MTQTEVFLNRLQSLTKEGRPLRMVSFISAATHARLDPPSASVLLRTLLADEVLSKDQLADSLQEFLGVAEVAEI